MKRDGRQAIGSGVIGLPAGIVLVWVIQQFGVDVPPEVGAAIGSLLSGLLGFFVKTTGDKEAAR
jgi:hypothetical protein